MNPVKCLVDSALQVIQEEDPTWDRFQPYSFRILVVETWKKAIRTELQLGRVIWSLKIGDRVFSTTTGLFPSYDIRYNPYA